MPAAVPSLERRRIRAYLLLVLADIMLVLCSFALGGFLYRANLPDPQALLEAQLIIPLYLTIALYGRVFSIRALTDGFYAARKAAMALLVAAGLVTFLAFYAKLNASFSRGTFTLGLIFSILALGTLRLVVARLLARKWGQLARNVLVLDAGGPAFSLDHAVSLSTQEAGIRADVDDPHMLDRIATLLVNQEEVIVTCPPQDRQAWALILKGSGVHGEIVSSEAEYAGIVGITRYEDQGVSGMVYSTGPLGLRARLFKRAFDIVVSLCVLFVLLPVLLLVALAIKLDDGGPVLFVQRRMGRGNRFFYLLKFRTMRDHAADHRGRVSIRRGDRRLTRIGGFLRRSSLDELPQLWNVIRGEMSIVGPRPHAIGSHAGAKLFWEVDGRYWHRHALKPGMTGLAQVRGLRGATFKESDLSRRLAADFEYIANWSLLGDLAIVIRTLAVLRHPDAF